jgi:ferredoxin-NADP reductase
MPESAVSAESSFEARLVAVRYAARDVNTYEFARPDGATLMDVEPGAHIDVALPNGITRQYSLISPGPAPDRYTVAVKRDPNSRGGSRFMHDELRVGQLVTITGPRNNFRLREDTAHTVLIAGGIGITPIWCMVQRLRALPAQSASWTLHYSCRTRAEAAFLGGLTQCPQVHLNFDDESGHVLDLAAVIAQAPPAAHLYCCGPTPMLAAFEQATANWPDEQKHVEYFTAKEATALAGGFVVDCDALARNCDPGRQSIAVLREADGSILFCEQGICGACETRVISGVQTSRFLAPPAGQGAGTTVMIAGRGRASGWCWIFDRSRQYAGGTEVFAGSPWNRWAAAQAPACHTIFQKASETGTTQRS